ncbi:MFS transporter [Nonomuraea sp. NPDC052116]|uniref:MFS transporter n=1 Tax=Nonomuraea sp. NPDC052116 TaxID=3155665 RepID=UPI003432DCF8
MSRPSGEATTAETPGDKARHRRGFWLLWLATLISGLGDGVRFVALPLLAATVTRDPVLIASVTVAGQLPWVVVGPVTGVLTDRLNRRRLVWQVAVFQAVLMGVFAVSVAGGAAGVAVIAVAAFLLASSETLSLNLSAALIPELVDERRLSSANSWVQGGQFVMSDFVGLSIGAVLFGFAPLLPFAVDSVTFAVAALLLLAMGRSGKPTEAVPKVTLAVVRADLAEGMRWLLRHRLLRTLCGLIAVSNFAVVGVTAIAVLYALEVLRVDRTTYGLLMVIVAVGGLAGLVTAPWLSKRLGYGGVLRVTFALMPVPFFATGLTATPLVAAFSFFFVGASISLGNVVSISLRQELVPAEMFGRVNSFYRLLALGLGPLGGACAGVLADRFGLHAPFLLGGALLTVTVLAAVPLLSERAVTAAKEAKAKKTKDQEAKDQVTGG